MEILANDIIKFKVDEMEICGVVKAVLDKVYFVHGNDGKEYKIDKEDIVEAIGKSRVNESRKNAESWQRDKK